jgi:hypothetical protein
VGPRAGEPAKQADSSEPGEPAETASGAVNGAGTSPDPTGSDPVGSDPAGTDPVGSDPAGAESASTGIRANTAAVRIISDRPEDDSSGEPGDPSSAASRDSGPSGPSPSSPSGPASPSGPGDRRPGLRARLTPRIPRPRRRPGGSPRPGATRLPGTIFAAVTIAPVLLVMAWLLAGLPLLLANRFSDIPMLIISVPLAVALMFLVMRDLPAAWPHGIRELWDTTRDRIAPMAAVTPETAQEAETSQLPLAQGEGEIETNEEPTGTGTAKRAAEAPATGQAQAPAEASAPAGAPARPKPDVPWWSLIATLIVAIGFAVWQLAENSQQVIVLRDPASYLQFAYWIAQQGSTHIPESLAAFGGSHPGMTFGSLGFFQSGATIVPQFMAGLPMTLAIGVWAGGPLTAVAMAPIIGACAILAFAGLAGRLAGGRWAPAAALVLAISLPEQYTSRNTFSETLAQIMLFGGLCMLTDSFALTTGRHAAAGPATMSWRDGPAPNVALAFFGGLAIGLTLLIRIDGISDLLPVIPFLGILLVSRRPQAVPLGLGLFIGVAYGLADGFVLSRPYLDSLSGSLRPLAIIALAAVALTGVGMGLLNLRLTRRWIRALLRARPLRWLPDAVAVLTVLVVIGFAVRPYFQTVRGETDPATISYVAELQKLAHLPIDGHRQYAEDSLYWVIWYLGVPAVILGTLGIALLARRALKSLITWRDSGAARIWALPLMITGWVIVSVLWRPGIIPDQPWASRRLVPVVLPGLILAATWMAAWIKERGRLLGASRVAAAIVAVCCVIALLVPAAVTTFGVGTTRTASGSSRPTAHGLAFKRTGTGEQRAVRGLCSSIGPNASVVIVDSLTADRFSQVIRGMCATPTARIDSATPGEVSTVVAGIEHAGRRPILLAGSQSQLSAYGGEARKVLDLLTTQDAHELTKPPTRTWLIHFVIWMSNPGGVPGGAVASQAAEYPRHA